ncbi:hypothetical protein [Cellulomonas aerilata]|uniref:DUF559 domain-containing protein n=1 Tax=Cellulomonas aerilata TaxID=515326 RepID=A0A512DCY3_9CELL|nr:hypothetical protein [Cellulomonas aerilata]GEO34336.1 hypothetical protein CAE01nite_20610 [Cellulomonas aerilata]
MADRYTALEFVSKARLTHGDRYDYSEVDYVNSQTKVAITCAEHGKFEQTPAKHLHGQGCAQCGGRVRLTGERFVERAREVHGARYDYARAEYINTKTKVTIVCAEHGEFSQTPDSHMLGTGCPKCADCERGLLRRGSTVEFIEQAIETHGESYDYSRTAYVTSARKVQIGCFRHGFFWQVPSSHLRGTGCPDCGVEKRTANQTSSTEEFVAKAHRIHGAAYEYRHVLYVTAQQKVAIECPRHGMFRQTPNQHLSGSGCPDCGQEAITRALADTKQSFIAKAERIHGRVYDYSEVKYVKSQVKVTIRCVQHGSFQQVPSSHLSGVGCPNCGREAIGIANADTTVSFVLKAVSVHGGTFDYSLVDYLGSQSKVTIICRKHGPFGQTPNSHLSGRGCPQCGFNRISLARAGSLDAFLDRAFAVHAGRFDYSKATWVGSHIKTTIACREHGEFQQTPASHLNGSGCPACAVEVRRLVMSGTSVQFIGRARTIHGDLYDYSATEYQNAYTKVAIGCATHGPFEQLPQVHLGGSGCPKCSTSKGEVAIYRVLTGLAIDFEHQWRDHTCRDLRPLAFDFALLRARVLIEFDGEQHRIPVRWGGITHDEAHAMLAGVQRRDGIKNAWAAANGWRMVRLTDAATVEDEIARVLIAHGYWTSSTAWQAIDGGARHRETIDGIDSTIVLGDVGVDASEQGS